MGYSGKYETPADILADAGLNRDEKIEMLESWRSDKRAFMRASGEGMQGSSRSDVLRAIQNALITLRGK